MTPLHKLICRRCGYEWYPKQAQHMPIRCGKCDSKYWQTPRRMHWPERLRVYREALERIVALETIDGGLTHDSLDLARQIAIDALSVCDFYEQPNDPKGEEVALPTRSRSESGQ